MRMMRFNPVAEHVPGKSMVIADTLSRSPLPVVEERSIEELHSEVEATVNSIISSIASPNKLMEIRIATWEDTIFQRVLYYTKHGWPKYVKDVEEELRGFQSIQNVISEVNGLLSYCDRIIIPSVMRSEMLEKLHEGHMGINKCKCRAEQSPWWPGIGRDIQEYVSRCLYCISTRPTQHNEPLKPTPLPDRPWQRIGADLCEVNGDKYLIVIDYYSRYLEILEMRSTTGDQIIGRLKSLFARYGIPEELISDNGPPFYCTAMHQFAHEYDFKHTTTSPYFAQANSEAEAAVRIAKGIIKQPDQFAALLNYRATPTAATGVSPAELLMGRRIRTTLPMLSKNLEPAWPDLEKVRECDNKAKESYSYHYNRRHGTRPLSELHPGDHVMTKLDDQKGWKPATVVSQASTHTNGDTEATSSESQ